MTHDGRKTSRCRRETAYGVNSTVLRFEKKRIAERRMPWYFQ